nr:MAG TPA: hypothetical protein [Caudoviricetes sp.]
MVFSLSQIYQIIIIWNNRINIFHDHSQNREKEKRPFKAPFYIRRRIRQPHNKNARVRPIYALYSPILNLCKPSVKPGVKTSFKTGRRCKPNVKQVSLFVLHVHSCLFLVTY